MYCRHLPPTGRVKEDERDKQNELPTRANSPVEKMSVNYEIFFGYLFTRCFPIKPIAPAITKLAGAS